MGTMNATYTAWMAIWCAASACSPMMPMHSVATVNMPDSTA